MYKAATQEKIALIRLWRQKAEESSEISNAERLERQEWLYNLSSLRAQMQVDSQVRNLYRGQVATFEADFADCSFSSTNCRIFCPPSGPSSRGKWRTRMALLTLCRILRQVQGRNLSSAWRARLLTSEVVLNRYSSLSSTPQLRRSRSTGTHSSGIWRSCRRK